MYSKLCIIYILFIFPTVLWSQNHLDSIKMKAVVAFENTDYNNALYYYERLEKKDIYELKQLGVIYRETGKYEQALVIFNEIQKKRKDFASYDLAKTYALLGDSDNALYFLEKHLESAQRLPEAQIKFDDAFVNLKTETKWKELWMKDWYNNTDLRIAEIRYLMKYENYREAIDELDKHLEKSHRDEYYALRASIFTTLGDYDLAIRDYNMAIKENKREIQYYFERGRTYMKSGEYKRALKDLDFYINEDPYQIQAYALRASIYVSMEKYKEAIDDAELYHEYMQTDSAKHLLATVYLQSGKYLQSLKYYNQLLDKDKTNAQWFYERAKAYEKTYMTKNALSDYGMALDLKPEPEYYLSRGELRLKNGDTQGACHDFKISAAKGNLEGQKNVNLYCGN